MLASNVRWALFIAAIVMLALPTLASAQPVTLQDAVRFALKHDSTVQQKAVALAQAQLAYAKQKGQTYPTINGTLENFLQKSANYGGSYAVIGLAPQNVFSQNTAQIGTQYTLNTGGLGLIQLAEQQAQLDQAKTDLQRAQDEVANTVTANFYTIAQKEGLVILDRSDLNYQHILVLNAQAKERAGMAAGVDVLRAQVAEEKSRSTLVSDQAGVQDAQETLAQSIGAPLATEFAVTQNIPEPAIPHGSLDTLVAIAQNSRPDIRSARAAVRNAQLARQGFDRELFPQIQLTAGFGNQFSPTNAVFLQNIEDQQFAAQNAALIANGLPPLPISDEPVVPRGSAGFWQVQAVTTFTLPLVDYGQRHAERANDAEALESAENTLVLTQSQAALDVHQNYRAAQTALAQLQYATGGSAPRHRGGAHRATPISKWVDRLLGRFASRADVNHRAKRSHQCARRIR